MRTKHRSEARLLLLDDDPLFGHGLAHFALKRGIRVDVLESLLELESLDQIPDYEAAIIDLKLGAITGLEVGQYLGAFFERTPFILISSDDVTSKDLWPPCIRSFVRKEAGLPAVLLAAMTASAQSA